ncbi:MAG TPA: rSAM-associated Gly-rich repeat protein [Leptolyngbyaceae cyanobacterium M65_K2018_010]|nr:rSAM-associated Gly-rich repeat protein [Leptolyngbyaceae cyanobacterium M65_K2018_010]
MPINNRISFVGFLVTLAALSMPGVALATAPETAPETAVPTAETSSNPIEGRLSRLSAALQARAEQLPAESRPTTDNRIARGFADGAGRGWVDGARTGWADGYGGDFVNRNAWRNGWGDGGGFANWHNY